MNSVELERTIRRQAVSLSKTKYVVHDVFNVEGPSKAIVMRLLVVRKSS